MILLIPCIYVCIDNPYKMYCHFRLCSQEIIRILSFILGGRRLKFFSYKFIWIKQKKKTKQRQTRTRQTPPPCSNHNKERASSYKKICFFFVSVRVLFCVWKTTASASNLFCCVFYFVIRCICCCEKSWLILLSYAQIEFKKKNKKNG